MGLEYGTTCFALPVSDKPSNTGFPYYCQHYFPLYWLSYFFWLISFLLSVVVILVKLHARVPVLVRVD